MTVITVDVPMERVSVQLMAKNAIGVVARTTLVRNAGLARDLKKSESRHDSRRPNEARKNRCSHKCCVHEIHEDECHEDSSVEDLNEQVQSLFYA